MYDSLVSLRRPSGQTLHKINNPYVAVFTGVPMPYTKTHLTTMRGWCATWALRGIIEVNSLKE